MSTTPVAQPRKAQARPAQNSVRPELMRIESASAPWWSQAPDVAAKCAHVAFMPLRIAAAAADAAVSLAFVGLGLAVYLWWTGTIEDEAVAGLLGQVGNRLLGIVKNSGLI